MRLYCLARRENAVCTLVKNHDDNGWHLGMRVVYPFHIQMWQDHGAIYEASSYERVEEMKREREAIRAYLSGTHPEGSDLQPGTSVQDSYPEREG